MKKLLQISLSAVAISSATAQIQVVWGPQIDDAVFNAPSQAAFDPTEATFELGIFGGGFEPTLANADLWDDNWVVVGGPSPVNQFSLATDNELDFGPTDPMAPGSGLTPAENIETGAGTSFPIGAQIYLWGYRNGENVYTPGSGINPEWILLTNDNNPNDNGFPVDPTEIATENWIIPDSNEADSHLSGIAILAPESGDLNVVGSAISQTGELNFVTVPEPTSALMIALSGLALLRRRR